MKKLKAAVVDSRHPPEGWGIVHRGSVQEGDLIWSVISEAWVRTLATGKRINRMKYLVARELPIPPDGYALAEKTLIIIYDLIWHERSGKWVMVEPGRNDDALGRYIANKSIVARKIE